MCIPIVLASSQIATANTTYLVHEKPFCFCCDNPIFSLYI